MNLFNRVLSRLSGRETVRTIHDGLPKVLPPKSRVGGVIGGGNTSGQQTWVKQYTIDDWINFYRMAINPDSPQRRMLLMLYVNILLDGHLFAQLQSRKLKTMSKPFHIKNAAGEIDEEKTKLFTSKWYRKFMELTLDSIPYGFTLIEFGDKTDDGFKYVKGVNRYCVRPEYQFQFVGETPAAMTGDSWNDLPWKNWNIFVGDPEDLGILNVACPLIIWKRASEVYWNTYQKLFVSPFRVGHTNIRDETLLNNMEAMMKAMDNAGYLVTDVEDSVEFVDSKGKAQHDAYKDFMRFADDEISKIVFGQTMTADNGSSKSQAEVHEGVAEEYAASDQLRVESETNGQLIPMMIRNGFDLAGCTFKFDNTENRNAVEQMGIDAVLLQFYDLPEDYILEKYGTPVTKKAFPEMGNDNPDSTQNQLKNVLKIAERTKKFVKK